MSVSYRPIALRVGPRSSSGAPSIELDLADGAIVRVDLDIAHAAAIRNRLTDILDGSITRKSPARRVLEISLMPQPTETELADTQAPPAAIVPDLETDRVRQAAE